MKHRKGEKELKNLLKGHFRAKAPEGFADRVMANVVVLERITTIQPVQANPLVAVILIFLSVLVIVVGLFFNQGLASSNYLSIPTLELSLSAFWIAPCFAFFGTIWLFILIEKRKQNSQGA